LIAVRKFMVIMSCDPLFTICLGCHLSSENVLLMFFDCVVAEYSQEKRKNLHQLSAKSQ
jgi:hypothetical protein